MAKLKGMGNIALKINSKIISTIQQEIAPMVVGYLRSLLSKQTDARGNRFPTKKESTKRQYKKQGWDTEHWLIRTNTAAQVVTQNISDGVRLIPADPEKILQYVDRSDDWFLLSPSIKTDILNKIKQRI